MTEIFLLIRASDSPIEAISKIDILEISQLYLTALETIYDEYGLRQPFDPNDITWGRSIYYRDQNIGSGRAITGWGYYVNLTYASERWTCVLNYGDFLPEQINEPRHDAGNHRGLLKAARQFGEHLEAYSMLIVENNVANAQANRDRRGRTLWAGMQFKL